MAVYAPTPKRTIALSAKARISAAVRSSQMNGRSGMRWPMSEDSFELDAEIIRSAYAEKVQEAFRLFAENISVGQNEKSW